MKIKKLHQICGLLLCSALASCSQNPDSALKNSPPQPRLTENSPPNSQAPGASVPGEAVSPDQKRKIVWPATTEKSISSQVPASLRSMVSTLMSPEAINQFSPQAYLVLARGAKSEIVADGKKSGYSGTRAFTELVAPVEDTNAKLSDIKNQYEKIRDSYAYGHNILSLNNTLVNGTLKVGTTIAAVSGLGTLPALTLGAITAAADKGLASTLNVFDNSAKEESNKFVARKLQELPASAWSDWDRLASLPPEQARNLAAKKVHEWSQTLSGNGASADQQMVRTIFDGYLTQAIVGQLAREQSLRGLAQKQIEGSLTDHGNQLVALSKTLVSFTSETQNQLLKIRDSQETLQNGIAEIKNQMGSVENEVKAAGNQVLKISSNFGFVQEFMFGRMTPTEQIHALKGSFSTDMSEVSKNSLLKKIQLVEQKQKIETMAIKAMDGAQSMINIASKFGVSPTILNTAQTGVKIAAAVTKAFSSFMSGGYLGAAESLIGLFGGSGPDIAQQRHEQIMGRFDQLFEGQKQIIEGEQVIIDNQKILAEYSLKILKKEDDILKKEDEIITSVKAMAQQVHDLHVQVMDKLDQIHSDVLINRAMIRTVADRETLMCKNFIDGRSRFQGFNSTTEQFDDFSTLREFFIMYFREFNLCNDGLEATIRNTDISQILLSSEAYNRSGIDVFLRTTYKPTFEYFQSKTNTNQSAFFGLTMPTKETSNLKTKADELDKYSNVLAQTYNLERLPEPIAADALVKRTNYLLQIHPYFELVNFSGGGSLKELNSILISEKKGYKAKLILEEALKLLNLAIAQESIIAGDQSLHYLYEELFTQPMDNIDCKSEKNYSLPLCIVQNNPWLGRNLVLYGIKEDLRRKGYNTIAYQIAKDLGNDDSQLKSITLKPWKFTKTKENKWAVSFGAHEITLPTPDELLRDEITYRGEMTTLLNLKEKVINALTDYNLKYQMENSTRKTLYTILLNSI